MVAAGIVKLVPDDQISIKLVYQTNVFCLIKFSSCLIKLTFSWFDQSNFLDQFCLIEPTQHQICLIKHCLIKLI